MKQNVSGRAWSVRAGGELNAAALHHCRPMPNDARAARSCLVAETARCGGTAWLLPSDPVVTLNGALLLPGEHRLDQRKSTEDEQDAEEPPAALEWGRRARPAAARAREYADSRGRVEAEADTGRDLQPRAGDGLEPKADEPASEQGPALVSAANGGVDLSVAWQAMNLT